MHPVKENYTKFRKEYEKEFGKFVSFDEFNYYFYVKNFFQSYVLYEDGDFQEVMLGLIRNVANWNKGQFFSLMKGGGDLYDKDILQKLMDHKKMEKYILSTEVIMLNVVGDLEDVLIKKKDIKDRLKKYITELIEIAKYSNDVFKKYKNHISNNKKKESFDSSTNMYG